MHNFTYENIEIKTQSDEGIETERKVSIVNGKGYKSVTKYRNGKKISSVKKPIRKSHISSIHNRQFIPGLFLDCVCKKNTRKKR